jgi:hypothetical protein
MLANAATKQVLAVSNSGKQSIGVTLAPAALTPSPVAINVTPAVNASASSSSSSSSTAPLYTSPVQLSAALAAPIKRKAIPTRTPKSMRSLANINNDEKVNNDNTITSSGGKGNDGGFSIREVTETNQMRTLVIGDADKLHLSRVRDNMLNATNVVGQSPRSAKQQQATLQQLQQQQHTDENKSMSGTSNRRRTGDGRMRDGLKRRTAEKHLSGSTKAAVAAVAAQRSRQNSHDTSVTPSNASSLTDEKISNVASSPSPSSTLAASTIMSPSTTTTSSPTPTAVSSSSSSSVPPSPSPSTLHVPVTNESKRLLTPLERLEQAGAIRSRPLSRRSPYPYANGHPPTHRPQSQSLHYTASTTAKITAVPTSVVTNNEVSISNAGVLSPSSSSHISPNDSLTSTPTHHNHYEVGNGDMVHRQPSLTCPASSFLDVRPTPSPLVSSSLLLTPPPPLPRGVQPIATSYSGSNTPVSHSPPLSLASISSAPPSIDHYQIQLLSPSPIPLPSSSSSNATTSTVTTAGASTAVTPSDMSSVAHSSSRHLAASPIPSSLSLHPSSLATSSHSIPLSPSPSAASGGSGISLRTLALPSSRRSTLPRGFTPSSSHPLFAALNRSRASSIDDDDAPSTPTSGSGTNTPSSSGLHLHVHHHVNSGLMTPVAERELPSSQLPLSQRVSSAGHLPPSSASRHAAVAVTGTGGLSLFNIANTNRRASLSSNGIASNEQSQPSSGHVTPIPNTLQQQHQAAPPQATVSSSEPPAAVATKSGDNAIGQSPSNSSRLPSLSLTIDNVDGKTQTMDASSLSFGGGIAPSPVPSPLVPPNRSLSVTTSSPLVSSRSLVSISSPNGSSIPSTPGTPGSTTSATTATPLSLPPSTSSSSLAMDSLRHGGMKALLSPSASSRVVSSSPLMFVGTRVASTSSPILSAPVSSVTTNIPRAATEVSVTAISSFVRMSPGGSTTAASTSATPVGVVAGVSDSNITEASSSISSSTPNVSPSIVAPASETTSVTGVPNDTKEVNINDTIDNSSDSSGTMDAPPPLISQASVIDLPKPAPPPFKLLSSHSHSTSFRTAHEELSTSVMSKLLNLLTPPPVDQPVVIAVYLSISAYSFVVLVFLTIAVYDRMIH